MSLRTPGPRFALALLSAVVAAPQVHAGDAAAGNPGESIYRRGVLRSGAPLEGRREQGTGVAGAQAACSNCHQKSGLGTKEGRIVMPPVTGRYLFRPRASSLDDLDLPYVDGIRPEREPYTEASLARAIREGLDSEGKPLSPLMPRYALGDADMGALIGHLKRLDQRKVPGVTDTVLHFATVVTPDADPRQAAGMVDVLEHFFADKNAFPIGPTPRLRSSRKMMFMVNRRWQLHVWRLSGPAATWQKQLERHLAAEPVLAVVSGIGGATWAPVQAFCEQKSVPCLFPNVEVPPADADHGFYSLYFSRGVLLEADLVARRIAASGSGKQGVGQIYRAGESGEAGARALAVALERQGIPVHSQVLARGGAGKGVAEALRKPPNTLVLWLHPEDLAALGPMPAATANVYMSGLMGGLENAPLPSGWRGSTRLAYPFDLPERRRIRVDYARGWFAIRRIPVVAEPVQTDTYLACGLLAEALSHMADTFVRDYLVERTQDMLEHRVITGYYPHLSLAAGQRFAAKGGYLVHFADPVGPRLLADSEWVVP